MGIINDVVKVLGENNEKCVQLANQIEEQESAIRTGQYADKYVNETVRPKINGMRQTMNDIKEQTRRAVREMTAQYAEAARRADDLNPADMTDDCKLLNCGVKLNADDLRAIVNRNPNNRTMLQLVMRYADEHGIKTGLQYNGSRQDIETAKNIDILTDRFIDQWMGNKRSGAAILERYFTPDNR